jgi:hypothetical protein
VFRQRCAAFERGHAGSVVTPTLLSPLVVAVIPCRWSQKPLVRLTTTCWRYRTRIVAHAGASARGSHCAAARNADTAKTRRGRIDALQLPAVANIASSDADIAVARRNRI